MAAILVVVVVVAIEALDDEFLRQGIARSGCRLLVIAGMEKNKRRSIPGVKSSHKSITSAPSLINGILRSI